MIPNSAGPAVGQGIMFVPLFDGLSFSRSAPQGWYCKKTLLKIYIVLLHLKSFNFYTLKF